MAFKTVKALVYDVPIFLEIFVIFVRDALLFGELPYPFNQVEIGAVEW